jgi:uncharacterized protein
MTSSRTRVLKVNNVEDEQNSEVFYKTEVRHTGLEGQEFWLDFEEESQGTKQLFILTERVVDCLGKGGALFVDEIDNSLHPILARSLVALFHSKESNPKNAQLIFATHDATLLDLNLLRKDEIWFVEKNAALSSELYSLNDFKDGSGAIEKGYLQGRYGAIPILGSALSGD